ncbi:glutathione S-transferase family protein [Ramlibacter sp. G-1-2-2]|uniref:Glutathione S-transferase family protein n=1 Tax=Ramlibacter agri TaxID=2728837 RepID=A0A848GY79_9BURK|nr:glutathione S-transferase family protein [Ramlibacter agri]NML42269.1 glutathione S-transferase family protein [Ramlibacter agri]
MTRDRPTLYSGPLSMFGAKAEIAAHEKGIAFDLVMVPFDFHALYVPKHPEVLRINPKAQVPVLVHGDLELFDSTQIFEYFEDLQPTPALWPRDLRARARARLLELQSDEVYFPHVVRLMGLQDRLQEPPAQAAIAAARAFYAALEARLADGRPWLLEEFTYADIAFYMAALFGERQGATLTQDTPLLLAWRDRMSGRAPVRKVAQAMATWLLGAGRPLPPFMRALLD